MRISIIIPTYRDNEHLAKTVASVQKRGAELIVADAGGTVQAMDGVTILQTPPTRAAAMNAGAKEASGDVLIFLHADTTLQAGWQDEIDRALQDDRIIGGAFHVRFDAQTLALRLINHYSNLRAKLTGMYHGDQAMFVRKKSFDRIGGFPDIPLMEDVVLSRKMRRVGKTVLLKSSAITSARRIEKTGILKSILRYFFFKTAFFFGAPPSYLAKVYRKSD